MSSPKAAAKVANKTARRPTASVKKVIPAKPVPVKPKAVVTGRAADAIKLDDMLIVDVDAHHYENEHFGDILPFMENEVFKQLSQSTRTSTRSRGTFTPQTIGYQDMGGRVTRYPMRGTEQTGDKGHMRDIELGHRWMDAMSVDYSCLFPTGMLSIGLHPQTEMEAEL